MNDVIITPNPEYRKRLLDQQRARMGIGTRREGVHVSDLLMCVRKSWAERQQEYVLEPPDHTVLTWLRGLSHEDLLSEGVTQVRGGYCFRCHKIQTINGVDTKGFMFDDKHPWYLCPECGDTLLVGTIDWIQLGNEDGTDLNDFIPTEMKSTLKSSRKSLDDMAWYVDQIKSYMAIWGRDLGRIAVFHVMGDYKREDKDVKTDGPTADLKTYDVRWRDPAARLDWLATLQGRKQQLEDDQHMPPLDTSSPAHPMICSYCAVGERLPNGRECEKWPWKKLTDGQYVLKSSTKAVKSMDEMMVELKALSEGGILET